MMMQRTANEYAACERRICKRYDQPKINRIKNNDARLILRTISLASLFVSYCYVCNRCLFSIFFNFNWPKNTFFMVQMGERGWGFGYRGKTSYTGTREKG